MDALSYIEQIVQVKYRSPKNNLVIFFAASYDTGTNADSLCFKDCRTLRVVTITGTGLSWAFGERIADIELSTELLPIITKIDQPEWWDRSQQEAIQELRILEKDPLAVETGKRLIAIKDNMARLLSNLPTNEAAKIQSRILTGEPLETNLEEQLKELEL